jgi:hypothetical protein
MKFGSATLLLLQFVIVGTTNAFAFSSTTTRSTLTTKTQLAVSIGLGPEKQDDGQAPQSKTEKVVLVAGVDYEIPDHNAYRTSRRSTIDETSDAWFRSLLMSGNDDETPFLGDIAMAARSKLLTPVELKNEVRPWYNHNHNNTWNTKRPVSFYLYNVY